MRKKLGNPHLWSNRINAEDQDLRRKAREALEAASASRRTANAMKNSDHDQSQLFKTKVNGSSSTKTKLNAKMSMVIDNPCLIVADLNTKLDQPMCVQVSKGLPSTCKFYLSQKRARRFLKDLLRASNSCY